MDNRSILHSIRPLTSFTAPSKKRGRRQSPLTTRTVQYTAGGVLDIIVCIDCVWSPECSFARKGKEKREKVSSSLGREA